MAAKRTAFGAFGGMLKDHTATDLGEIAARAALKSASINPENIDHIVFGKSNPKNLPAMTNPIFSGNVIQSSRDAAYLARHIGLRIGVPVPIPAVTINRLCGSGFEAIIQGCQASHFFESFHAISIHPFSADPLRRFEARADWRNGEHEHVALRCPQHPLRSAARDQSTGEPVSRVVLQYHNICIRFSSKTCSGRD